MPSPEESETPRKHGWTDDEVDRTISGLLRFGLLVSGLVVVAGGLIFLLRHGGETASYQIFRSEPPGYREIPSILAESARFRGRGLIMAGLIVLMATPVARVAFSVLAFIRQRDGIYVAATLLVLGILLFSVFWLGLR
jgi:uncharacterized membrane protein